MITKQDLQLVRQTASGLKAMVIGDAMLDIYIYGLVERISPEAPVPVLTHQSTQIKAGGAANVALNLASWGCQTSIVGMTGDDSNAVHLMSILNEHNIRSYFHKSPGRPTTVKTRVVAASHHLLRIDEESTAYPDLREERELISFIQDCLDKEAPDLVILEDYNKGVLSEKVIASIISYAREHDVFVAVDPKDKNFNSYKGIQLFKPNLREASHAARKTLKPEHLHELAVTWSNEMKNDVLAITLGAQGIFLHEKEQDIHIKPARSIDVIDVCGAGDAVICALALSQMSGLEIKKCGELANLTGAYVCSHSGVVAIDPVALEDMI